MKHRRHKVKREHSIVKDALLWLEELSKHPAVTDIIPGVIEVSRSPERGVVYKYQTATGCKLLLKSNGTIQEAFVVTKDPAAVRDWVAQRFPSASAPHDQNEAKDRKNPASALNARGVPSKHAGKKAESAVRPRETARRGPGRGESRKDLAPTYWRAMGDLDNPSLGERLDLPARRALQRLQRHLSDDLRTVSQEPLTEAELFRQWLATDGNHSPRSGQGRSER